MTEKLKEWWEYRPYYVKKKYNYVTERSTVRKLYVPWFGWTFTFDRTVGKKFKDWG